MQVINVYRTLSEPNVDQRVLDRVRRGEVDVMTFASLRACGISSHFLDRRALA